MKHWATKRGAEVLDPTPLEIPLGAGQPPSIQEMIAKYVHETLKKEENLEPESWEEANDFEEEDPDTLVMSSRYELKELEPDLDATYDPDREPTPANASKTAQEAPQEEISTKEGPTPRSKEEAPTGASE